MTAFFAFARPDSTIVYTTPLYGGTTGLIHRFLKPLRRDRYSGARGDTEAIEEAIRSRPQLLHGAAGNARQSHHDHDRYRARRRGGRAASRPAARAWWTTRSWDRLSASADARRRHLTLYSATKYLSGNSDMLGGVAITDSSEIIQKIRGVRSMFGNILQPDECWMLDGRLSTVALRMNRQSKNAQRIAEALHGHQAAQPGDLSDAIHGPRTEAHLREAVRLSGRDVLASSSRAERRRRSSSCGTCGSRAMRCRWAAWNRWPAIRRSTTHSGMSPQELAESGVTDGLVRVSVGIEDWRDLLADFEQALAQWRRVARLAAKR